MAGLSDIEWTDATWNPVIGCSMVSPGCTNCYAMRMAARLQSMQHPLYLGVTRKSGGRPVWTGRVALSDKALEAPLKWRKPRKIFVNSMSDLFQDDVPADFVARVWQVMEKAHWHVFQVLTKRPEIMLAMVTDVGLRLLPNVWLGTSVESADYAHRIDTLKQVPASIRFVSFEPLLAAVGEVDLEGVHWAIVGGESGPKARPLDPAWIDQIESQCRRAGTAFFFKQWGGKNKKATGRIFRDRTWDEYPQVFASTTQTT
jgi:protein gp37